MDTPRFFCRPITQPHTSLSGNEAHHLISVLRCHIGDQVSLFDGQGASAQATIIHIKSAHVELRVDSLDHHPAPSRPGIIIAVSPPKGDRFDWLIGKCTEVGVDRICPIIYERTVKLAQGKNTQDRWHHMMVAAAKQCGLSYLPQIDAPSPLAQAHSTLCLTYPDGRMCVGSLSPSAPSLLTLPATSNSIVFIGPEGGFTPAEEAFFDHQNIHPIRLTDTILRVETAALAAAIILAARRTE